MKLGYRARRVKERGWEERRARHYGEQREGQVMELR
jgi:hypothetical protein